MILMEMEPTYHLTTTAMALLAHLMEIDPTYHSTTTAMALLAHLMEMETTRVCVSHVRPSV